MTTDAVAVAIVAPRPALRSLLWLVALSLPFGASMRASCASASISS